MKPMLSFIIPVFNSEKYLEEAIDSILSCAYSKYEIILIDDVSDDTSYEICKNRAESNKNIKVYQHENAENKGVSFTRKLGVDMAIGDYIYFLDSDDKLFPGIIEKYLNIFDNNKDIVLVHGEIKTFNKPNYIHDIARDFIISGKDKKYKLSDEAYFLKSHRICTSTCMVKKDAIADIDFSYKQIFPMGEDWLMLVLLSEKGLFYYYSDTAVYYRVRTDSVTIKSHKKGEKHLKFNLLEFYIALFSKSKNQEIKDQIRINLQTLINELPGYYKPVNDIDDIVPFPQEKKLNILDKKIYNLERGYGYYFYFIYLIKSFIRKVFKTKKN